MTETSADPYARKRTSLASGVGEVAKYACRALAPANEVRAVGVVADAS